MRDTPTPIGAHLSHTQIDRYWSDGYLFPTPIMDADEAAGLRAELETLEAQWLDNGLPLPLNT